MFKSLQYALLNFIVLLFPLDCTLRPGSPPSPLLHSRCELSFLSAHIESAGDSEMYEEKAKAGFFFTQKHSNHRTLPSEF